MVCPVRNRLNTVVSFLVRECFLELVACNDCGLLSQHVEHVKLLKFLGSSACIRDFFFNLLEFVELFGCFLLRLVIDVDIVASFEVMSHQ